MTGHGQSFPISLAPSILTADFGHLADQVMEAEDAGADRLHLDVMDGRFVPNITFGPVVIGALRKICRIPFDVHLMIENPAQYVQPFREAGGDRIIVHVEATRHLHRVVEQIKRTEAEAGVAINPSTPIIDIEEIAPFIDFALVMSVNPGFGGQSFIETTPRKIFRVRRLLDRHNASASVGVDGGIDSRTIESVVIAGADCLVAGAAVYNPTASVRDNLMQLRRQANEAQRERPTPVPTSSST